MNAGTIATLGLKTRVGGIKCGDLPDADFETLTPTRDNMLARR
jgi:hypothetical protein